VSTNSLQAAEKSFFEAFNANDIDAVIAHYESGGAFVEQNGELIRGADAIRQTLAGFFAMKPKLTKRGEGRTLENGDLAIRMQSWKLQGTAPDGSPVEMEGAGFDVVRRQPDGSWKMVIDNPWGAAILD
jgi:ketosteroid isomerase-like protein